MMISAKTRRAFSRSLLLLCFPIACVGQEPDYAARRARMVAEQLARRDISEVRVLEVMGRVPRHLFVPPDYRDKAYEDYPLPIGEGQTISQPYIVALMTQWLSVRPGEKVLEVGTGSGYQAAVLAELGVRVLTIEINEPLAQQAARTLKDLGYDGVRVQAGDGFFGWPEEAPFDAVIVTCAVNRVPPPLFEQLREGGRLILPLGDALTFQTLTLVTKVKGRPQSHKISGVRFVPMTGEAQKRKNERP